LAFSSAGEGLLEEGVPVMGVLEGDALVPAESGGPEGKSNGGNKPEIPALGTGMMAAGASALSHHPHPLHWRRLHPCWLELLRRSRKQLRPLD